MAIQPILRELCEVPARKYAEVNQSLVHVLKSSAYFEDAEKDPMPDMLEPLSWQEVKRFLSAEVSRLSP